MRRRLQRGCSLPHHPRNGDKFITFGFVPRNQPIGSDHRLRAIRSHLLVPAVVQQDHVAAANLLSDFALDDGCWRRVPVIARDIPHDRLEAKFTRDAEHRRAASSERRAEEIGVFADCVLQRGAAFGEFAA